MAPIPRNTVPSAVLAFSVLMVIASAAALACGPAALSGQGAGNATSTPKSTLEPTHPPMPTICLTVIDDDGRREECYPSPVRGYDRDDTLETHLESMAEEAKEQAEMTGKSNGSRSDTFEPVRVRIEVAKAGDVVTVTEWLNGKNISTDAYPDSGVVYAVVPVLLLTELAAVDGVVRVWEQRPPNLH